MTTEIGKHSARLFKDFLTALERINKEGNGYIPGSPECCLWYISTEGCEVLEPAQFVLRMEMGMAYQAFIKWEDAIGDCLKSDNQKELMDLITISLALRENINSIGIPFAELNPGVNNFGIKYPGINMPGEEQLLSADKYIPVEGLPRDPIQTKQVAEKQAIEEPPGNANFEKTEVRAAAGLDNDWSTGQSVLGDYIVEKILGEGGMGIVYLVRSYSTGQSFAVKRAKITGVESQRLFFSELQTWIDLPEYPHLVAFRFFRAVGSEIAIFAEFVEGGSLQDWIAERWLYEGGSAEALKRMLDIAIQFAWGLDAAHQKGMVHQDVKPGNVLIASDETVKVKGVKVTDFGLARARSRAEAIIGEVTRQDALVSHAGGYTPAFCSPEQGQGLKLSLKSDLWSWGVSVLAMFRGGVFWQLGQVAPLALEDYVKEGAEDRSIPKMPASLVELLRQCFQSEPEKRPESMGEISARLQEIFKECTIRKETYHRSRPPVTEPLAGGLMSETVAIHDRGTSKGVRREDPRKYLIAALEAGGRDSGEAEDFLLPREGSLRAQAIGDLAAYEEAQGLFEQLISSGRKELEPKLAKLLVDKALVHDNLGDLAGSASLFDKAIQIHERLVNREGRSELANDLAMSYMYKACAISALGDSRAAVDLHEKAIQIFERLVKRERHSESANYLALIYTNKANAVSELGNKRAAVVIYDKAIQIYERLVSKEWRTELAIALAMVYMNKALAVSALGDNRVAVDLYDKAIQVRERLVTRGGRSELANDLDLVYLNKALAVNALGDSRAAVNLFDKAIQIYEQLVTREGRSELANALATVYMSKATVVNGLGDGRAAVNLFDKAIQIYERLVNREGRSELANTLAMVYMNKAGAVSESGDSRAAVNLFDKAIQICERLVIREGRSELANGLAMAYTNKAIAVSDLGDSRAEVDLYEKAIQIYERLVYKEGRPELIGELSWVKLNKAEVLQDLGDIQKAKNEAQAAIRVLRAEVKRTGRADLRGILEWAETDLGMLLK